jgi:hypothetical protein
MPDTEQLSIILWSVRPKKKDTGSIVKAIHGFFGLGEGGLFAKVSSKKL